MDSIKYLAVVLLAFPLLSNADSSPTYYECSTSYIAHHHTRENLFREVTKPQDRYIYVLSANDQKLAQVLPEGNPKWLGISARKYKDLDWHRLDLEFEAPGSEFTFYEKTMRFSIAETTGFLTGDPNISARISFGTCHKVTQKHYDLLFSS